jgi:hypothetical protein
VDHHGRVRTCFPPKNRGSATVRRAPPSRNNTRIPRALERSPVGVDFLENGDMALPRSSGRRMIDTARQRGTVGLSQILRAIEKRFDRRQPCSPLAMRNGRAPRSSAIPLGAWQLECAFTERAQPVRIRLRPVGLPCTKSNRFELKRLRGAPLLFPIASATRPLTGATAVGSCRWPVPF